MKISVLSIPALNSSVRWRHVDDEAVVLVQDCAEVLVVNQLGAGILDKINGDRKLTEIIDSLLPKYDVSREQLQIDVLFYTNELAEAGVISLSTT